MSNRATLKSSAASAAKARRRADSVIAYENNPVRSVSVRKPHGFKQWFVFVSAFFSASMLAAAFIGWLGPIVGGLFAYVCLTWLQKSQEKTARLHAAAKRAAMVAELERLQAKLSVQSLDSSPPEDPIWRDYVHDEEEDEERYQPLQQAPRQLTTDEQHCMDLININYGGGARMDNLGEWLPRCPDIFGRQARFSYGAHLDRQRQNAQKPWQPRR